MAMALDDKDKEILRQALIASEHLRDAAHGMAAFIEDADHLSPGVVKFLARALRDVAEKQREAMSRVNELRGER
jgi:hypothetical protein